MTNRARRRVPVTARLRGTFRQMVQDEDQAVGLTS
jgi:hypothetical protein